MEAASEAEDYDKAAEISEELEGVTTSLTELLRLLKASEVCFEHIFFSCICCFGSVLTVSQQSHGRVVTTGRGRRIRYRTYCGPQPTGTFCSTTFCS